MRFSAGQEQRRLRREQELGHLQDRKAALPNDLTPPDYKM
jgi:hypothetical protein